MLSKILICALLINSQYPSSMHSISNKHLVNCENWTLNWRVSERERERERERGVQDPTDSFHRGTSSCSLPSLVAWQQLWPKITR